MNKLDLTYANLLEEILRNGRPKTDRTSTGTISTFGVNLEHEMIDGFPILTTKKMAWRTIKTELCWFLMGDTNIKWLIDNDCNIWNGDAYANYLNKYYYSNKSYIGSYVELRGSEYQVIDVHRKDQSILICLDEFGDEVLININNVILKNPLSKKEFIAMIKNNSVFAKYWGELGPIYGKQWVNWDGVNQIDQVIINLMKNPNSRRHVVSAWNVSDLPDMVLPPCHMFMQFYVVELNFEERKKHFIKQLELTSDPLLKGDIPDDLINNTPKYGLSLMWYQRSVDTFLGLPFNITSYGLLLTIVSKICDMYPHELKASLGDTHIYNNHLDAVHQQLTNKTKSFDLPMVEVPQSLIDVYRKTGDLGMAMKESLNSINLKNYQHHEKIKAPLSN